MDVLSDVLGTVRLTGSIFFTADFYEPWAIQSPSHDELLQNMPTKAECISFFHIITEGKCQFKTQAGKPFLLEKGSVIIFPHSCIHTMGSTMEIRPTPAIGLKVFEKNIGFSKVEYGGNGDKTQFLCGYLLCDQRFNPLLGAVPEVLILSSQKESLINENPELSDNILSITPKGWLNMTLQHLAGEVKERKEGSATLITRLIELMYIEVLRRYMKDLPANSKGWFAGVRDPEVGKALKHLHSNPELKWNVKQLACKVGVSRSAFANRFAELMGESPIRYLTNWRMQLAKNLLQQPQFSLAKVAEKVGYDSDIAFNRAFKRCVGLPPAQWRNQVYGQ